MTGFIIYAASGRSFVSAQVKCWKHQVKIESKSSPTLLLQALKTGELPCKCFAIVCCWFIIVFLEYGVHMSWKRRIIVGLCLGLEVFLVAGCSSSRDTFNIGWTQLSGAGPSPRWAHVAVLDPARKDAVVFGGFTAGNEVWIFSFASGLWTRVDAPNGPTPRNSPSAVSDPINDRMVLVGGINSVPTDEVWAFSFATHAWSPLPKGPSPRYDMGAATDGVHAWFYGGFLPGLQPTDELWQFDFASNTWSLLPQSQVRPSPRTNMGIAVNAGSLYIIGGHDATGLTPGTWKYDLATNQWTELTPTGTAGAAAHFASATDDCNGTLLLAGGDHDDDIDINTSDVFSFAQPSFTRLPVTSNFVPGRRHSTLVLEPESRTLMLFGGLQDPSNILGDTWLYQVEPCAN